MRHSATVSYHSITDTIHILTGHSITLVKLGYLVCLYSRGSFKPCTEYNTCISIFSDPGNRVNNRISSSLKHRHNGHDGVSNHQPRDCSTQPFIQAQIKENINTPRHWLLWGKFTGDRWIPPTKGQKREFFSIWWRHHVKSVHTQKWAYPIKASKSCSEHWDLISQIYIRALDVFV